jgi:K+/H+ antiporter YhaU regulatory subunit KhtT
MASIISLLTIITLSILITRIATVALTQTGLSRESARFQARSAFTGVGFTTGESEKVVNHPVRRRILLLLMLLGNAGIVTAVTSLLLGFINTEDTRTFVLRIILLSTGLTLLWILSVSGRIDRHLSRLIGWALNRYTRLDTRDFASLLGLTGDYRVTEMQVEAQDWISERSLKGIRLRDEGIVVLGLTRENGKYIGAPDGSTRLKPGDTLILYGRASAIEKLDRRLKGISGDEEHVQSCSEQEAVVRKEKDEDLPNET